MSSLTDAIGLSFGSFSTFTRALPPGAMSLKELRAILSDKRLELFLNRIHHIERIEANERGYVVSTAYQSLQIDVAYSNNGIGPAKIELNFHEPTRIYNCHNIIDLENDGQAKECLKFLQNLIGSNKLWEFVGPSDRLFKIIRSDEGYLVVTARGKKYTASFEEKSVRSFISSLWGS